jgi:hypothetical protein
MRAATMRVQTGKTTSVSASCQQGEQMLGGDFAASNLFEYAAYIEASYPANATTWSATASAPASYFDLEVAAYCLSAATPVGVQVIQADGTSASTAVCPQDMVLLSGGFQSAQPVGVSRPQGNGWMAASSGVNVQAYALCAASHVARGRVVTATFNAHSTTHNYAPSGGSASCPAGQLAIGGGFEGGDLITASEASGPSFAGWSVAAGGDAEMTVSAVCVQIDVSYPGSSLRLSHR